LRNHLMSMEADRGIVLIRAAVGLVFLPEGMLKLFKSEWLGADRFAAIGIPFPDLMGPFVGLVEIICGALILLGLLTRYAAFPLIIVMLVAILSTKIPILVASPEDPQWWIFSVEKGKCCGLWKAEHAWRTDFSMLMSTLFLLIAGGGEWSIDRLLTQRQKHEADL